MLQISQQPFTWCFHRRFRRGEAIFFSLTQQVSPKEPNDDQAYAFVYFLSLTGFYRSDSKQHVQEKYTRYTYCKIVLFKFEFTIKIQLLKLQTFHPYFCSSKRKRQHERPIPRLSGGLRSKTLLLRFLENMLLHVQCKVESDR